MWNKIKQSVSLGNNQNADKIITITICKNISTLCLGHCGNTVVYLWLISKILIDLPVIGVLVKSEKKFMLTHQFGTRKPKSFSFDRQDDYIKVTVS